MASLLCLARRMIYSEKASPVYCISTGFVVERSQSESWQHESPPLFLVVCSSKALPYGGIGEECGL